MKMDTSTADPPHTLIPIIIKAQSITTHTEATLDHTTGSTEDMTGAAHDAHTCPLTNINPAMTPHCRSSTHRSSSAYSRDHSR